MLLKQNKSYKNNQRPKTSNIYRNKMISDQDDNYTTYISVQKLSNFDSVQN
jgi:hypothetical protein